MQLCSNRGCACGAARSGAAALVPMPQRSTHLRGAAAVPNPRRGSEAAALVPMLRRTCAGRRQCRIRGAGARQRHSHPCDAARSGAAALVPMPQRSTRPSEAAALVPLPRRAPCIHRPRSTFGGDMTRALDLGFTPACGCWAVIYASGLLYGGCAPGALPGTIPVGTRDVATVLLWVDRQSYARREVSRSVMI